MSTNSSNRIADLKSQVEALEDGHEAKAILEILLENAESQPEDSRRIKPILNKVENILQISSDSDEANAARRKELFTIPNWMVKGSNKLAQAFAWWKQNKALGFVIEDGKVSFAPKEVIALPDYSKPNVRNGALADAPDEESAEAAAKAVRDGHARRETEAESKAEQARREAEAARAKATELAERKEGLQAKLDASEAKMHEAQAVADHEAGLLAEVTETVRLLEGQIGEMKAQKDAAESKTTAMTARAADMQKQRAQAHERVPELETQLQALQTAFAPVEARLKSAEEDHDKTQQELDGVLNQIRTLQEQVDQVKLDISTAEERHNALVQETQALQNAKDQRQAEAATLLEQMKTLRTQRDTVNTQITAAEQAVYAAKADSLTPYIPEDQERLFPVKKGYMADDGMTGVVEMDVRKHIRAKKGVVNKVRVETVAGNLTRLKDAARPDHVSYLNSNGDPHPLVGQGNNAEAYMDGDTLVLRVQSAYASLAQVKKNDKNQHVLLMKFDADTSNKGVVAHSFTVQVTLQN